MMSNGIPSPRNRLWKRRVKLRGKLRRCLIVRKGHAHPNLCSHHPDQSMAINTEVKTFHQQKDYRLLERSGDGEHFLAREVCTGKPENSFDSLWYSLWWSGTESPVFPKYACKHLELSLISALASKENKKWNFITRYVVIPDLHRKYLIFPLEGKLPKNRERGLSFRSSKNRKKDWKTLIKKTPLFEHVHYIQRLKFLVLRVSSLGYALWRRSLASIFAFALLNLTFVELSYLSAGSFRKFLYCKDATGTYFSRQSRNPKNSGIKFILSLKSAMNDHFDPVTTAGFCASMGQW